MLEFLLSQSKCAAMPDLRHAFCNLHFKALYVLVGIYIFIAIVFVHPAMSTEARLFIPNYWDEKEPFPKPDLSSLTRVRFLTTTDFPPFNFLDSDGRLTGFHIDLARAICRELDVVARCQIQALPWNELDEAIAAGQGEVLIAGTAITRQTRKFYTFTRPYLQFPARFSTLKTAPLETPIYKSITDKRIGVFGGSVHEAILRNYFPNARAVTYSRLEWLYQALRDGKIDAIFSDGMQLSFWITSPGAQDCCTFSGGPYFAPEFLGTGMAMASAHDQAVLAQALNHALREISTKGVFAELYLKYFPVGFY